MNESPIFQRFAQPYAFGAPAAAWPVAVMKAYFVDCPIAVASHLQGFATRQAQEQAKLISDISREENVSAVATRQAQFFQQAGVAWTTELMELAELVQSKISGAFQASPFDAKVPPPPGI